jgi:predicted ATPase/class 3 adenylate cyclase
MPRTLPTGTVTFLFTDIEGSTRLVTDLAAGYLPVLERHHELLRAAFLAGGGVEVATEGDSFFVVFPSAPRAVAAAAEAQRALAREPWPAAVGELRVRMGMHTGEGVLGGDNYAGLDVHRAARIAASAHGGQVVLSATTTALVESALPDGVTLRDLGEHRLKDLDRPESIAQLVISGLPADFPPLRTLDAPTNLPAQLTSFVGREHEVAAVARLLKATRLLTLTGPGGTGKTRLSLRVADDVRQDYPGGTFFVELAPISDPSLIATTIATAMGLREDANRPVLDSLKERLRHAKVLLVLDNFEQLVDGSGVVGELLVAAPGLTVLTSSREILRLRGEQEFPVPPLGLPDLNNLPPAASLSHYDAVALFIQRAVSVRPDFAVTNANAPAVAAICARLDGLPLAIELAAARIKVFAPDAILARLEKSLSLLTGGARDLPARQQTLRGAIDWSYNLLDEPERTLFRRLSVFRGGWTFDTAQEICDPASDIGLDVVDGLLSFVDKSLVRRGELPSGEPRFRMLETIREYAADRLREAGEAGDLARRHGLFFAKLVRDAEPELLGANQAPWLDRLELDRDNVRAAMHWATEAGETEIALTTAGDLWRFWHQRAHLSEGREVLEAVLSGPDAAAPTRARAIALTALGGVVYWQGRFDEAERAYEEALAIFRVIDDPSGLADALYNAAFVKTITHRLDAARPLLMESIAIYERLGDRVGVIKNRETLAFALYLTGEYAEALALEEDLVRELRGRPEPFRLSNALTLTGLLQVANARYGPAREFLREAIDILRASGDVTTLINAIDVAAFLLLREGRPEQAAMVSGAVTGLREPLGELASGLNILSIEDPRVGARAALGDATFEAAVARGKGLGFDDAIALALARPEAASGAAERWPGASRVGHADPALGRKGGLDGFTVGRRAAQE